MDDEALAAATPGAARAPGVPRTSAHVLHLQRQAGNRAVQGLIRSGPPTVQRGLKAGVKKALGMGSKQPAWAKAEQAGLAAQDAKILSPKDLEKQISTLESATRKLGKAHSPGQVDLSNQVAATQVHGAAERILKNAQKSGASPALLKRLRWIVDENQLILDEARVEGSRRKAQNIFLEAGRKDQGAKGALSALQTPAAFSQKHGAAPAPNQKVLAKMKEGGFTSYDQMFSEALAAPDHGTAIRAITVLQPELGLHTNLVRGRETGLRLGLSEAEVAAIQAYTANDYSYINPATSNDPAWIGTFGGKAVGADEAETRKKTKAIQEEGSLQTAVGVQGLLRLPLWKGQAYRGQMLQFKQFHDLFVKDGEGFRPRNPTFTWKTITSISKDSKAARDFVGAGRSGIAGILWTLDVTNGRDIEPISVNRGEEEVAILPGSSFAIGSIEVKQIAYADPSNPKFVTPWHLEVRCKQVS